MPLVKVAGIRQGWLARPPLVSNYNSLYISYKCRDYIRIAKRLTSTGSVALPWPSLDSLRISSAVPYNSNKKANFRYRKSKSNTVRYNAFTKCTIYQCRVFHVLVPIRSDAASSVAINQWAGTWKISRVVVLPFGRYRVNAGLFMNSCSVVFVRHLRELSSWLRAGYLFDVFTINYLV